MCSYDRRAGACLLETGKSQPSSLHLHPISYSLKPTAVLKYPAGPHLAAYPNSASIAATSDSTAPEPSGWMQAAAEGGCQPLSRPRCCRQGCGDMCTGLTGLCLGDGCLSKDTRAPGHAPALRVSAYVCRDAAAVLACRNASAALWPPATRKAPSSASMASASTLLLFCGLGTQWEGGGQRANTPLPGSLHSYRKKVFATPVLQQLVGPSKNSSSKILPQDASALWEDGSPSPGLTLTASGEAQLRMEKDSTRRRRSRPSCGVWCVGRHYAGLVRPNRTGRRFM